MNKNTLLLYCCVATTLGIGAANADDFDQRVYLQRMTSFANSAADWAAYGGACGDPTAAAVRDEFVSMTTPLSEQDKTRLTKKYDDTYAALQRHADAKKEAQASRGQDYPCKHPAIQQRKGTYEQNLAELNGMRGTAPEATTPAAADADGPKTLEECKAQAKSMIEYTDCYDKFDQ